MKKLLLTLTVLILISCSTFKLSTHNYDPIYGPSGNEIEVEVINTQWDLNRKLQNDFQFRYDFAQYAMNQPYGWYFQHRTFNSFRWNRFNSYSTYDMYFNRDNFWMDWAFGSPFNYGWSNFGWNNWGFNNWNNNYYGYNMWGYNTGVSNFHWQNRNRDNRRVSYSTGRRGSNTINRNTIKRTVTKNNGITIRTNVPRNPRTSTAGNTLNIDNAVEIIRRENKGRQIRVYSNPNNIPNVIIRGNRNNNNISKPVIPNRSSWRSNSNPRPVIRSNSTRRSNTSTSNSPRSSSSRSNNKGGRGNNNN
tara:strand:+ start:393 stop:1304 length:912 start_codon:yes stop_codon:yes gene_type:complete